MDDVMSVPGGPVEGETNRACVKPLSDSPPDSREATLEHSADREWNLPKYAPGYLQPRDLMRSGGLLSDPELRGLVDEAWAARIQMHVTVRGNSHPASREDFRDQYADSCRDRGGLRAAQMRLGRKLLGEAVPPKGLSADGKEEYVRLVGDALLRACYWEGCMKIDAFEQMWHDGEWGALAGYGWISREDAEELKLWSAQDYDALVRRGGLCAEEAEYLKEEAAQDARDRAEAAARQGLARRR